MQIVINIPKEIYENALNNLLCSLPTLVNAIKNGKPLKTGHWIERPHEGEKIGNIRCLSVQNVAHWEIIIPIFVLTVGQRWNRRAVE